MDMMSPTKEDISYLVHSSNHNHFCSVDFFGMVRLNIC